MADQSVIDYIARFFLGKGLTREQTAGILGNLEVESGFNPNAKNENEGAIGIAQWRLGRRKELQLFAARMGGRETDLKVQVAFIWHELTTPGMEQPAMRQLATATTAQAAAAAFDQHYERSDARHRQDRIDAAIKYLKTLGPGAGDPGYVWDQTTGQAGVGITGGGSGGRPLIDLPLSPTSGVSPDVLDGAIAVGGFVNSIPEMILGPLFIGLFVAGGVVIVAIGLAQAVKPAATKVARGAQTVIQTVKP